MAADQVLEKLRSQLDKQSANTDIGLLLESSNKPAFATWFPNPLVESHQDLIYGRFDMGRSDLWEECKRMRALMRCLRDAEWKQRNTERGRPEPERTSGWYLVTMVAVDQWQQSEGRFRIYYLFSCDWNSKQQPFLLIEYPLLAHTPPVKTDMGSMNPVLAGSVGSGEVYPSITPYFRAAQRFECEIYDMFRLVACHGARPHKLMPVVKPGLLLFPDQYPPGLAPLRKDKRSPELIEAIERFQANPSLERQAPDPPSDEYVINPVGPIHGGVFPAATSFLKVRRGRIEGVDIQLGYKHRGIEKLFEERCSLVPNKTAQKPISGCELAENAARDSAFGHSLAYCHAVETLLGVTEELPRSVVAVRGLFLELERMVNHVGDCAALARDVSQELLFTEMSLLREYLVRLQHWLTDHRLLTGVNHPGGITISEAFLIEIAHAMQTSAQPEKQAGAHAMQSRATFGEQAARLKNSIDAAVADITLPPASRIPRRWLKPGFTSLKILVKHFDKLGEMLLSIPNFLARTEGVGRLTSEKATRYGVTGLMARASGLKRDTRITHPCGAFRRSWLQGDILTIASARTSGDILSRVAVRLHEVQQSFNIIQKIVKHLPIAIAQDFKRHSISTVTIVTLRELFLGRDLAESDIPREAGPFALGYAESWRGDIVYFVMKGEGNTIARCAVGDASFRNYNAIPNVLCGDADADYPLSMKSCNLSPEGHDR
jgi:Ni,Fe-hydrogenase III large subunit